MFWKEKSWGSFWLAMDGISGLKWEAFIGNFVSIGSVSDLIIASYALLY